MPDYVERQEFREETSALRNKIEEQQNDIVKLSTVVESMRNLPETITELSCTLKLMQVNLEQINKQIGDIEKREMKFEEKSEKVNDAQNSKISTINDKSKVDFLELIKSNFWNIVVSIAMLILVIERWFNG